MNDAGSLPQEVGKTVRLLATHHDHGDGWRYRRGAKDLVHIRYRQDFTGPNHWLRRLGRALDWGHLTGRTGLSRALGIRPTIYTAAVWFLVALTKDKNLPDGSINGNIIHWEEDGEYIESVGPTVGEKIADFLENDPTNPYALAIAIEIQRIWAKSDKGNSPR